MSNRPDREIDPLPTYAQLQLIDGTNERTAWGTWGSDDELGSVNRLTSGRVLHAATLVRTGAVISLNLPLDQPTPGLFEDRQPYEHHMTVARTGRDDRLDGFYLQYSTQWDGLRHIRYREHGYWGGRQEADLDASNVLGIDRWAQHGIVGRGVLIDALSFFEAEGVEYAPWMRMTIGRAQIEQIAEHQGVSLGTADILLLRTGWLDWVQTLSYEERAAMSGTVGAGGLTCAGLDPDPDTAAWLWDTGIAAIAADNPALEALPVDREQGFQHRRLIPLLGMPIGEFWDLKELATACKDDGRYEFMLVSAPLHVPGGVGSPANAYAIR